MESPASPPPEVPPPNVEVSVDASEDALRATSAARFSAVEEAALLSESDEHRAAANALFAAGDVAAALGCYADALAVCPTYLSAPRAVLHSNTAACHVRLEAWAAAVDAASAALTCLDANRGDSSSSGSGGGDESGSSSSSSSNDGLPIRLKSLMRRATAHERLGGWQHLAAAEDDYRALEGFCAHLRPADRALVRRRLAELPAAVAAAREHEVGEMWGKLKELGNGLMKPFGVSTDNFRMVRDETTGSYSMNFQR